MRTVITAPHDIELVLKCYVRLRLRLRNMYYIYVFVYYAYVWLQQYFLIIHLVLD